MSTGGIFQIITNDGKQDRMLMASELLKARLTRIMQARAAKGMDPTPALADIEKTHILFMNAHFKPFAAIGYEYNKVRASAGTVTFGSTVQFSIPQFGDFFHDMVLHVRAAGPTVGDASHTWRYVDFPGERLLDKVSFTVNGNPLDTYYKEDYCFKRQFELPASKKDGYWRCAGQQIPRPAQVVPGSGASLSAAGAGGGIGETTANNVNTVGTWVNVTDGYQTPKTNTAHALTTLGHTRTDILELTMPLKFWFNEDPRLSVASVSIPHGQRFIEIDLAAYANIAQGIAISGSGGTDSTASTLTAPSAISVCDLYVNNIFVNPEVHDIFIKRIGFNLIRVHRRQLTRVNGATGGELLLNNMKWPIECIYFGFRPAAQVTAAATRQYLDGWHVFGELSALSASVALGNSVATLNATMELAFSTVRPLVNKVSFKAHGVAIYNEIPAILFNQYLPLVRGDKLSTPSDPGVYVVTFNLYPGVYQPSGHLNVSRAREFYVSFDDVISGQPNLGTVVSSSNPVDFVGSAKALNFLLISDGSAVLRYST